MSTVVIPARRGASDEPRVSITAPKTSRQTRIAFNASLIEKAKLAEVRYVALELDEARKRLRFVPCDSVYAGQPAHKLLNDGGKQTASRILLVPRDGLKFLPTRPYEPLFARNGKTFEIEYGAAV